MYGQLFSQLEHFKSGAYSKFNLLTPFIYQESLLKALLPWPDSMHIGLNAQEALLEWGYSLVTPIWLAGFPDAPFPQFNVRPIRRVSILSFIFLAWHEIRTSIVQRFDSIEMTPTRRFFVDILLWIFEEAIPLALDSPALLASGDTAIYVDTLKRLLPLFIRFRKQNYIVVIAYTLAAIAKIIG